MSDRASYPDQDDEQAEREGNRVENLHFNREHPDEPAPRDGVCIRNRTTSTSWGSFCP